MSWCTGLVAMKCPICGSWDTSVASRDTLNSDLLCRPCGRIVWSDEFRGEGVTIENVYYADGSIKESIFTEDDETQAQLHSRSIDHDDEGRPIVRSLQEVWPEDKMDKVTVRLLHS